MGTQSRRVDVPISRQLFEEGFHFTFFQAVRLCERLYPDRCPVGYFASPTEEVVRFESHLSSSFPPSDIHRIVWADDEQAHIHMLVAFLGLTGPKGVLPRHYTTWLFQRNRQNDQALQNFFDLFNHRLISLFYRAWVQSHPPIAYEQARRQRHSRDAFSQGLLALSSTSCQRDNDTENIQAETLMYYAGLLCHHPRSGTALTSLLSDYFDVPVAVKTCIGQWLERPMEDCARLGANTTTSVLGRTTVMGSRSWNPQALFRLRLGPMALDKYCQFLPPGHAIRPLLQLTRLFAGHDRSCEIQLVLQKSDIPLCRLGEIGDSAPRLGWTAWLPTHTGLHSHDPDDAIFPENIVRNWRVERQCDTA